MCYLNVLAQEVACQVAQLDVALMGKVEELDSVQHLECHICQVTAV